MKHFGSHPNEECRNEFSAYSTDVMFGQWFLTLTHQVIDSSNMSRIIILQKTDVPFFHQILVDLEKAWVPKIPF